ncbi:uncharacterized protein LOC142793193 [Rhipicephalus microplus]|uniref:uncharacterized protein LOC142793193 n=1 Tax=Rhipicephalus microplus TaxID=6941 RepID=UPI003F6A9DB5
MAMFLTTGIVPADQHCHGFFGYGARTDFRADACADSVFAQPGYITYIGLIQKNTGTAFAKFVLSWTCCTCNDTAAFSGPALMSTITRNSHSPPSLRFLAHVVVYFKTLTFESVASVPKYDQFKGLGA